MLHICLKQQFIIMRDVLLSATAGFLASCAAAFAVHRSLWKAAHDHAQLLDDLAGKQPPAGAGVPKRKHVSRTAMLRCLVSLHIYAIMIILSLMLGFTCFTLASLRLRRRILSRASFCADLVSGGMRALIMFMHVCLDCQRRLIALLMTSRALRTLATIATGKHSKCPVHNCRRYIVATPLLSRA